MTGPRRITVLSAGLSTPSSSRRLADRLAQATGAALRRRGIDARIETVEVRHLAHDVVDATLTRFSTPDLDRALRTVTDADGLIAVSPTFNASFSGLFKSFVDLIEPGALEGLPVLIGAAGGSQRHSLVLDHALRPLFGSLHALVLPTGVYAASADGGTADPAGTSALSDRIRRAGGELGDAVAQRPSSARRDAVSVPDALEELLRALD